MTVTVTVEIDDKDLQAVVGELQRRTANLTPLHESWGHAYLGWTDRNFRRGGSPKWKPVKRKGQPLRDTGRMANSFTYEATAQHMRGGTTDKKAPWHHFGTRPYAIVPKKRKFLSFVIDGKRVFARRVNHPGLAARPLLPTQAQVIGEMRIVQIAQIYLDQLRGRFNPRGV